MNDLSTDQIVYQLNRVVARQYRRISADDYSDLVELIDHLINWLDV